METTFKIIFLLGLIAVEVIRFPHRKRNQRERKEKKIAVARTRSVDFALDLLSFAGTEVVPLVYIFTPWLDFANYELPAALGWIGALVFAAGLYLLWRAHADLGRNWSPTVEIAQGQSLVTAGVYRYIRHPIYAALWLFGLAQALLLWNWIAGLAGLVCFIPVYYIRVPREEQMMLDHFGQEYRAYMSRTGGVIPRGGGAAQG